LKFDCGLTYQDKQERKRKWHLWFAWHPITIGSHDCRWLEKVYRKGRQKYNFLHGHWLWEYKAYN